MNIGIVPDPLKYHHWPKIKAMLEPAAKRGGVPILEAGELVWTAEDEGEVVGAATARLTTAKIGEVVLVGGIERKRWIEGLDSLLTQWFGLEGMTAMRAFGRKGWKRELEAMGWRVIGEEQGVTAYEKVL